MSIILDAITIGVRNAVSEFAKIRAEQLHHSKLEAEKANVAKSNFIANISHEIRTPLGAILGYTELLKTSSSRSEREGYVKIIARQGKLLSQLIDNILDLSKVEAGSLEVESVPFNLRELLDEVLDLFFERAKTKGLRLWAEIDPAIPMHINSDPLRLRQILINLVGNSIKFTPGGFVKIVVTSQGRHLSFSVEDSGIGIADEDVSKLFQPFVQADSSMTRKFGGTGLGLSLSRQLARALGGDVNLEKCKVGEGCMVVATIEAKSSEIVQDFPIRKSNGRIRTKILLVDDSPDNQDYIEQLLKRNGMDVDVACDGRQGVDMAQLDDYDIILMDVQMPILNGHDATMELRKYGYTKPIVALTAHSMFEDHEKSRAVGCDAHLTKPIIQSTLIRTIHQLRRNLH